MDDQRPVLLLLGGVPLTPEAAVPFLLAHHAGICIGFIEDLLYWGATAYMNGWRP